MDVNDQIAQATSEASISANKLAEAMQQVASAMAQIGAQFIMKTDIMKTERRVQKQELPEWI